MNEDTLATNVRDQLEAIRWRERRLLSLRRGDICVLLDLIEPLLSERQAAQEEQRALQALLASLRVNPAAGTASACAEAHRVIDRMFAPQSDRSRRPGPIRGKPL